MKLLLVNPNFKGVVLVPSLGLGFIASYLKNHSDCKVEVIEPILQALSEKDTLAKVRDSDILGLICYTESRFACFDFAQKAKKLNPECRIVVGGPHVNTLDVEILNHCPFIDVVVRSEGEETMLEIVKDKPLEEINGIAFRKNGKVIKNPERKMISNIDNLDFDYSSYLPWIENWKDREVPSRLMPLRHLPIIASRGCPFHCSFCTAPRHWGKILRMLSPQRLVEWLRYLVDKYNIGYFRFYDSLFIGSEERILQFCDLLEKENLKISFRIDIRAGTHKYVLERLKKVGCDIVGFGIESGSDRILNRINKGIKIQDVEETIKISKELGFWLIGFFMLSLPDENLRDIRKTLSLFNYFDVLNVQFFKIHPNTKIYDELKLKKELDDRVWFVQNFGFNREGGNQVFYCKEIFSSANFYYDEINLIIAYSFEILRSNKLFSDHRLAKYLPLLIRFFIINLMLRSIAMLRIYTKFKDSHVNSLIKIFLRYLRICQ